MLKELHIKNVAVIDEAHIEFTDGFNVLTGETGAGKSILIDSINLALGSRTNRDIIRHGCDFASVDICFEITSPTVLEKLSELGIDTEDGIASITRKITADGKTACRINGILVTANMLREAASYLIDIHGQNDNHSLLNRKNHLSLLDEYGTASEILEEYKVVHSKYTDILREINDRSQNEDERKRRLELLSFQIDEIRTAKLKSGEDDELEQARERLYNAESIVTGAGTAYSALYGGDEGTAYDLLRCAERALSDICRFDSKLSESFDRLTGIIAEAADIASDINTCLEKSDFNMAELEGIEERLDTINTLKRKYGGSIEEINAYADKAEVEASEIENSDERLAELYGLKAKALDRLSDLASLLSEQRAETAKALEEKIALELSSLDMPKVRFAVSLTENRDGDNIVYGSTGKDTVEFLISANVGEELKPISKIASGGELSRIMLAVKSVLSEADAADTMIFDEIDTGVSGRAAQRIAEKICVLSRNKQIFAITHLAQIASMADSHYLIEKEHGSDKTAATVTRLKRAERVDELARIIGGVAVTELTRQSAREMLDMADEKKKATI